MMKIKDYEIKPLADLRDANLCGADLRRANLRSADLRGANLSYANLRGVSLSYVDLSYVDLCGADLRGANLRSANLRGANLMDANLRGADLRGANLPPFQIVPSAGSFIAWKKTTTGVIKIRVPAKAKRTSSLVGRKCRAEYVVVLSGDGCNGFSPTHGKLQYKKGETIVADKYDDDIRVECTHGIHFFMTKEEAEQW